MGYTTDFEGSLELKRPLSKKKRDYLNLINSTRRMNRDVNKLMELYKGKHGNPFVKNGTPEEIYGVDGEFFARDDGQCGQGGDASIVELNGAPATQPGLWCQWMISEDGKYLLWDGGEKFYEYVEWLKYIIEKFFIPWGVKASGTIEWFGESREDIGQIKVTKNVVKTMAGEVTYRAPDDE